MQSRSPDPSCHHRKCGSSSFSPFHLKRTTAKTHPPSRFESIPAFLPRRGSTLSVVRCKPDAVSASGLRCNRPATRLNTSFLRRLPGVRDDFLHCAGGCVLQEQALLLVRASGLSACAVHLILFPTPKMTMKKKRAIKDRSDIYSFSCAVFKQATTA